MKELVYKELFDPADSRRRVTASKNRWWWKDPGVASILASLRYVEIDKDPAGRPLLCGVDGIRLYCNPKWIACLTDAQLDGLMMHEAAHVFLLHPFRRGDRHPDAWNVANDKAINSMIKDAGYDLPDNPPPCLPDDQSEWLWSSEMHYRKMEDNGQIQKVSMRVKVKNDKGEDVGEGTVHGDVFDPTNEKGEGYTEDQKRSMAEKAARDMSDMLSGKEAGTMSQSAKRRIDDLMIHTKDWREILREFVTESTKTEIDWTRPNKRLYPHGFHFPALTSPEEEALKGVIMVDTSGSIDDQTLSAFQGEINAICEAFHIEEMRVIYFSDHVHAVKVFKDGNPVKLKSNWSGGTDFVPPFAEADKHMAEPGFKFALMFTDLECGSYPPQPNYPTLFANYNQSDRHKTAPFGTTVPITP